MPLGLPSQLVRFSLSLVFSNLIMMSLGLVLLCICCLGRVECQILFTPLPLWGLGFFL